MDYNNQDLISVLNDELGIAIEEVPDNYQFNDYYRVQLDSSMEATILAFLRNYNSIFQKGILANAYYVKFPSGIPHTLMALKQGGYSTAVRSSGRFAGSASLYPLAARGPAMAFAAVISMAAERVILNILFSSIELIDNKLDTIVDFLYNDKNSELISEISYLKYVNSNYGSICSKEDLRMSTIIGLQSTKKVAIKNIEFYRFDIESLLNRKVKELKDANLIYRNIRFLEYAEQLYMLRSAIELYLVGNFDKEYVKYIKNEMKTYVKRSEITLIKTSADLIKKVNEVSILPTDKKKIAARTELVQKIEAVNEKYSSDEGTLMEKLIEDLFTDIEKSNDFIIDKSGKLYLLKKPV